MRPVMSSLLRRTIRLSRVSPLAQKHHQQSFIHSSSSCLTRLTQNPSKPSLFIPFRFASSSSAVKKLGPTENLVRVIESEIECAEESDAPSQGGVLPAGFPFKIIDNPGEQTITLKREFAGETIQVEVSMPDTDTDGDEQEDDDEEDDKDDNSTEIGMSLIVTVVKGDGPRLEFSCFATPDDITIESMLIKEPEKSTENAYEGPHFTDLEEELQKSFYEYLKVRGIENSLTNFLQDYMLNKESKEYVTWLKNMKEFVAK